MINLYSWSLIFFFFFSSFFSKKLHDDETYLSNFKSRENNHTEFLCVYILFLRSCVKCSYGLIGILFDRKARGARDPSHEHNQKRK